MSFGFDRTVVIGLVLYLVALGALLLGKTASPTPTGFSESSTDDGDTSAVEPDEPVDSRIGADVFV